jgi:hypothetical protein
MTLDKNDLIWELEEIKSPIKCAKIITINNELIILKLGYTITDLNNFLNKFEKRIYISDNSIIWFEDNTWLSVDEYDVDAYAWKHNKLPSIPNELFN